METVRGWTDGDLRRLDEIILEGERRFKERQPRSGALFGEALGVLAGGATSSWQIARPQMIWVSHGEGSKIYDADGGEYVDLHGGYGVGAVGHGHPKIVEALTRRVPRGT
ncbi:MAG TPA: aminotransferase class III-fold pyridoxal phosphate-dependent enzyme, partial [Rubrobacter sp.]|nr:aminotransferase class III-fold pyridoxal phosphate-dependent enzyme [Rubrobacter sp.]